MKTIALLAFLLTAASTHFASASDLVIERLITAVPPVSGNYYIFAVAECDKAEAESAVFGPFKGESEARVVLKLPSIEKLHWCKVTVRIDPSAADVKSSKALEKHTARFQVADSGTEVFIPFQNANHTWIWKLDYSTR